MKIINSKKADINKQKDNNRVNKNSGITLIALVVTIVVLIILATISINEVLGENGLIAKSQQSKELHEQSVRSEEDAMNTLLQKYENALVEPPQDPTANWNLSKVDKVTSEDGVMVPVPKGYTASTVDGEKEVGTGFVIKEGTNGGATEGINEFVWVPVPDITDLHDSANNAGQLWDFGTTSSPKNTAEKRTYPTTQNSGCREPDVVTEASSGEDSSSGSSHDAVLTNLQQAGLSTSATVADFKIQLQNEFNTMKNSVKKYGGFYIGRYETGNLSQSEAVVQKNNSDISGQTWYTMYKVSKTVKANDNVISSMIWGCQWDATLRWMQTSSIEKVKNFPINSGAYGNYKDNSISYVENGETKTTTEGTGTRIPTGSSEETNINNIYDMAGNVWDWSLEARDTHYRVTRGGCYNTLTSSRSSGRLAGTPTNRTNNGSRLALYVAL